MTFKQTLFAAAACASAVAVSAPASAEVILEEDDRGFVTRDSVVVAATPYETWQALIAPAEWWNDGHTWSGNAENMYISAQANGCFCELLPELKDAPEGVRRGSARHMSVVQASPPNVLRMRGGLGPLQSEPVDGVLTITISPQKGGEGTLIVWEYVVGGFFRFEVPVIAKAVDGVMSQQMNGLAKLLGTVTDDDDEKEGATSDSKDDGDGAEAADDKEADEGESGKDAAPKLSVDEAFNDLAEPE